MTTFPSPCGVWVVSGADGCQEGGLGFPSPCGVWVVSITRRTNAIELCFRPLAGCGLFRRTSTRTESQPGFRPLAGCGSFLRRVCREMGSCGFPSPCGVWVVSKTHSRGSCTAGFRPLAGCGLFPIVITSTNSKAVSVPLRGVGCFGKAAHSFWCNRKKNCQLCYFIVSYWQMFINSKLRNCKVPCEAHKTAT